MSVRYCARELIQITAYAPAQWIVYTSTEPLVVRYRCGELSVRLQNDWDSLMLLRDMRTDETSGPDSMEIEEMMKFTVEAIDWSGITGPILDAWNISEPDRRQLLAHDELTTAAYLIEIFNDLRTLPSANFSGSYAHMSNTNPILDWLSFLRTR